MNEDVISTLVSVRGAQAAISQLEAVREAQERVIESARAAEAVGGAAVAVAGAAAAVAVTEYERLERLTRVFQANLGEREGLRAARDMREFSRDSTLATQALDEFSSAWVAATGEAERIIPMLDALNKASKAGGLDGSRSGQSMGQVAEMARLPVTTWGDIENLARTGIPLRLVSESLGLDGIRDLAGMNTGEFFQAFIAVFGGMPDSPGSLFGRVAQGLKILQEGLAPTGAVVSGGLAPLAAMFTSVANLAASINDATGGWAGIVLLVSALVVGFRLLQPALMEAALSAIRLAQANRAALAGAMGAGAVGPIVSVIRYLALIAAIQKLMADPNLRAMMESVGSSVRELLAPMLEWASKIAKVFNDINDSLGGWPAKLLAVLVIMKAIKDIGLATMFIQIASALPGILAGLRAWLSISQLILVVEQMKAIVAAAYAAFVGNWVGLAVGLGILALAGVGAVGAAQGWWGGGSGGSGGAADRPARRNDLENILNKMQARQMAL